MDCTCIALNHDHKQGSCRRRGRIMGGICDECRYWKYEEAK